MKRKTPTRRLTLLIDADVLAYQAASGEQRVYEWDTETVGVALGTLEECQVVIQTKLDEWMTRFHASHFELCLTDEDNFRKRIYPLYKSNRRVKPVLLPEVRKWMLEDLRAWKRAGLEGDDVLGILATHPALIKGPKMIVSIDKDMKQIPGTLFNPMKDALVNVTREEGEYFHAYQTICGDPTDFYPGIKGRGDKFALKLLENDPVEWWPLMVAAAKEKGMSEDDLLVQARVARILRYGEFNFHTKEPILWAPPSKLSS